MSKVQAVFLREYLERVKRRSFAIGLVLVPLFMAGVIFLPIWLATMDQDSGGRALVLDADGAYKADFEAAIQSAMPDGSPRFVFVDREPSEGRYERSRLADEDYLAELLETGLLDWYLRIPADPGEEPAEFHGRVVSDFALLELLEAKLTGLLRRERMQALDLDPELLERISARADIRTLQHRRGEASEAGFESLYFSTMVMVMILYMTIVIFGSMIQRSVLEDKNQHVTEVVLSSMSATRFFAGKILGIGAVGLTQYLAWLLLALAAAGFGLFSAAQAQGLPTLQPAVYLNFVLFYVLGFMLYAGLFAAVGAMSTTDQEAQQLMQPIVMTMVIPMMLIIYIFRSPDSTASVVLSLIPLFSPLIMFMRINISSPPLWQLLAAYAILLGSVALVFVVSGRIFRVGILMTGKKASLVEAWRWVRSP